MPSYYSRRLAMRYIFMRHYCLQLCIKQNTLQRPFWWYLPHKLFDRNSRSINGQHKCCPRLYRIFKVRTFWDYYISFNIWCNLLRFNILVIVKLFFKCQISLSFDLRTSSQILFIYIQKYSILHSICQKFCDNLKIIMSNIN